MSHWRVLIITNSCQTGFTSITSQLSPPSLAYLKANPRYIFLNKYFSLYCEMIEESFETHNRNENITPNKTNNF